VKGTLKRFYIRPFPHTAQSDCNVVNTLKHDVDHPTFNGHDVGNHTVPDNPPEPSPVCLPVLSRESPPVSVPVVNRGEADVGYRGLGSDAAQIVA
jgi:hypothetical protein